MVSSGKPNKNIQKPNQPFTRIGGINMKNIRKASAFHQNWWYKPLSIVNPHKPSKIGGFSPYGMWFSISYQMVRENHLRLVGWFIPMDPHGSPPIYGKFKGMVYGLPTEAEREAYIALLLLYYWCYYWFTVNSCDKPIAMLEYVYVHIYIYIYQLAFQIDIYIYTYIYYWFTIKDLQYDSSVPPFQRRSLAAMAARGQQRQRLRWTFAWQNHPTGNKRTGGGPVSCHVSTGCLF